LRIELKKPINLIFRQILQRLSWLFIEIVFENQRVTELKGEGGFCSHTRDPGPPCAGNAIARPAPGMDI
jgi:hypothetical protein